MKKIDVNPVIEWIKWRIKKNKNVIVVLNGPTGSGKTYSALRLAVDVAEQLGTNFTVEGNMDFKFTELLKKTMREENKQPGTVFLFEEVGSVGSGASASEWQSQANKFFFSFLQTTRHRQQVLIFTCPNFSYLSKGARELVHLQIEMQCINFPKQTAIVKPYILQTNPKSGKQYFKFLRFKHNGKKFKLSRLELKIPPDDIIKPYEKLKTKFTTELNQSILDEAAKLEQPRKRPTKVNEEQIFEQFEQGMKNNQLARIWNASDRTIVRYRKKYNASKRTKK